MRWDETQKRLLDWTAGSGPSEAMAALILAEDGYTRIKPSLPGGGRDGRRDAEAYDARGRAWVMGVYFPRGQKSYTAIEGKVLHDAEGVAKHSATGLVFVTNQKTTPAERVKLKEAVAERGYELDLIDLEAVATVLDRPHMHANRLKYLDIGATFELDVDVTVSGSAWAVIDDAAVREHLLSPRPPRRPEPSIRSAPPPALLAALLPPLPAATPTEAEREQKALRRRRQVERDWPSAIDYMAARGLPALGLTITNKQPSFLEDVEMTLTIQGSRAVTVAGPEFELKKMLNPAWTKRDIHGIPYQESILDQCRHQLGDLQWGNHDGAATITARISDLRVAPPWVSADDELVVLAADPESSSLTGRWTVTAKGYGTVDSGVVRIPVRRIKAAAVLNAASQALRLTPSAGDPAAESDRDDEPATPPGAH